MALGRVENGLVEEDHDPPVKLQGHVDIDRLSPHAPGQGEFPEMLLDQAQGAEHVTQGNPVAAAFNPEGRVIVADVGVLVETAHPLSELGEDAEDLLEQA